MGLSIGNVARATPTQRLVESLHVASDATRALERQLKSTPDDLKGIAAAAREVANPLRTAAVEVDLGYGQGIVTGLVGAKSLFMESNARRIADLATQPAVGQAQVRKAIEQISSTTAATRSYLNETLERLRGVDLEELNRGYVVPDGLYH